jgi:hypothetical protein
MNGLVFQLCVPLTANCPEPDPEHTDENWCPFGALIWGVVAGGVGAGVAMAIDAAVIARKPAAPGRAWNLVPTYEPRTRAMGLALTGSLF